MMILSMQLQEDMEWEPCQVLILQTTHTMLQIRQLSEQVTSTLKDIQVRFTEQETQAKNSRLKEHWNCKSMSLTKQIFTDQDKHWSIIVQDMLWTPPFGIAQAGLQSKTVTLTKLELNTENNSINRRTSIREKWENHQAEFQRNCLPMSPLTWK